jgi:type VI secretion system protein ImpL
MLSIGRPDSSWAISLSGCVLTAIMIWFLGPLLPILEDWVVRSVVVLLLPSSWMSITYASSRIRYRRDAALAEGVAANGASLDSNQSNEEISALQTKLTALQKLLKNSDRGRRLLSEQPWYTVIGPPGAGKTTALLNAGLRFAPGAEGDVGFLQGVGGTRSCEWWFTEQAVLIDTAGRYTTQDSHGSADRAGWYKFLELLKNTRPKAPLNGLIVAISLGDVAASSSGAAMEHARTIQQRVGELQAHLGIRIPTYLLFTKADLVAGFTEFFGDMDDAERSQVWGMTFDLTLDPGDYATTFAEELRALVGRLEALLFRRLQTERSLEKRNLIAMFPSQIGSLEQPIKTFLGAMSGEAHGDKEALFLRGVYFTSATQEGTPIDRLTGTVARTFGLELSRSTIQRPEEGQSYFLEQLLHEVIFGEARLISTSPITAKRREIFRLASLVTAVLMVLTGGGLLWQIRASGLRDIKAMGAAMEVYQQAERALPSDRVADANLKLVAPLVEHAGALQYPNEKMAGSNLYFSQDTKLGTAAHVLYRHALERIFLPRLVWRLESQMRSSMDRPDFLYDTTHVYLMVVGAGPLDQALVRQWMRLDWQALYHDDQTGRLRDLLSRHLDALLSEPLPAIQPDGDLVARARDVFAKVSPAQHAYARIQLSVAAHRIAPWRPGDVLGGAGIPLFTRSSGKSLSDGIPGFYTVEGFHTVLLPCLNATARTVAKESWVLRGSDDFQSSAAMIPGWERDIVGLYESDYARTWDGLLADLNVVPLKSVSQAAQDLYILSSPQSPMRALLTSIARQLTLSVPMPEPKAVRGVAGDPATSFCSEIDGADPQTHASPVTPLPWIPGREIDERYKAVRALTGNGPGAPIDLVLRSLGDMQQRFAKAWAASGGFSALSGLDDPSPALRAEALRQPEPLAHWLTTLATTGGALRNGSSKP